MGLRVLSFGASVAEGGVPIVSGGKVIGAIGVSGVQSHQDAQVAQAGAVDSRDLPAAGGKLRLPAQLHAAERRLEVGVVHLEAEFRETVGDEHAPRIAETLPSVDGQGVLTEGAELVGEGGVGDRDRATLTGGKVLVGVKTKADGVSR